MSKKLLVTAAIGGMMFGASCAQKSGDTTADQGTSGQAVAAAPTGECHGVNACKGKGECGGKGHSCAGKNKCKGKGWTKLTQADCTAKKGTFKASSGH